MPDATVDYYSVPMEGYITLSEMARRLGLSQPTLRQQIAKKVLRAEKFGRDWAVSDEEYERYRRDHHGKRGFASPLHKGKPGRKPKVSTPDAS